MIQTIALTEYLDTIRLNKLNETQVVDVFKQIIEETVDFNGNSDMLDYLINKAITFEKHHRARNFIVEDSDNNIVGFFSLSLRAIGVSGLTKNVKKQLLLKGKSPNRIDTIPVLLIGQFGKNTKISKDRIISGENLFLEVLKKIELFRSIVGTQIVFLDSINHPKVIAFYQNLGFVSYSELISDENYSYQPMALKLSP